MIWFSLQHFSFLNCSPCLRYHFVLCSVCLQPFQLQALTGTHRWCLIPPTQRPLLKTALLQWETTWSESLTHTWQKPYTDSLKGQRWLFYTALRFLCFLCCTCVGRCSNSTIQDGFLFSLYLYTAWGTFLCPQGVRNGKVNVDTLLLSVHFFLVNSWTWTVMQ